MSKKPSKLRVTQSLLSAWGWVFKKDEGWDEFIAALNRQKKPMTEAMLDGIRYENCLNSVILGEHLPEDHEWKFPITEMAEELRGSSLQVTIFRDIVVDDQPLLLHGVLDYLREGHIWDCKFSKRYELNKYHWTKTPQTAMYLTLVPEAYDFTYIISDGKYVYREYYPREIVPSIEPELRTFMKYLKQHDLWKIFEEKWSV